MRFARFDEPKETARTDRDYIELREEVPGAPLRIALEHRNAKALAYHGGAVHPVQAQDLGGAQQRLLAPRERIDNALHASQEMSHEQFWARGSIDRHIAAAPRLKDAMYFGRCPLGVVDVMDNSAGIDAGHGIVGHRQGEGVFAAEFRRHGAGGNFRARSPRRREALFRVIQRA